MYFIIPAECEPSQNVYLLQNKLGKKTTTEKQKRQRGEGPHKVLTINATTSKQRGLTIPEQRRLNCCWSLELREMRVRGWQKVVFPCSFTKVIPTLCSTQQIITTKKAVSPDNMYCTKVLLI